MCACALQHCACAATAEGALDHFDAERYLYQIGVPRHDMVIPMLSAGLTAVVYRIPAACKYASVQFFARVPAHCN